jgi:virginiamycin B lyase
MRSLTSLGALGFVMCAVPFADAATITGTVTGPDGAPFRAAFVQARNAKTKITVSVLSDNQGHYRVPDLAAGDYRVQIRAPGFRTDPKNGVALTADQNLNQDFALQKGVLRWADISLAQGEKLLPAEEGKDLLFKHCFACHGFESRMAAITRNEDGWRARVNYMKDAMGFFIMRPQNEFTEEKGEKIVQYLTKVFGEDSVLPRSPTEVAGYADTVRKFSDEALKIVYVEYETPGPDRMPWAAHPDKDGYFWAGYYGRANKIARLDPKTGEMKEFPVPNLGTAAVHSAMPAPDGTVWLTEQGSDKLGKWDPVTQQITEYQDSWGKHTVRIAPDGMVWSTGGLTRFDPKTEQFAHITDVPNAYGIALDKGGNVWFAELRRDGRIGKVDAQTLKVTKYQPPTATGFPRRIQVGQDGNVWFAEFQAGKIGQFDPKSERFKEFTLPGPRATPYALDLDHDGKVWYSSEWMDVIGKLDPASGQVTEYPIPHAENTMREFYQDKEGRMWFGSPANDRLGYFYVVK